MDSHSLWEALSWSLSSVISYEKSAVSRMGLLGMSQSFCLAVLKKLSFGVFFFFFFDVLGSLHLLYLKFIEFLGYVDQCFPQI